MLHNYYDKQLGLKDSAMVNKLLRLIATLLLASRVQKYNSTGEVHSELKLIPNGQFFDDATRLHMAIIESSLQIIATMKSSELFFNDRKFLKSEPWGLL